VEVPRGHTDNQVGVAAEFDRLPDELLVAPKGIGPQAVTDDSQRLPDAWPRFLTRKKAPARHLSAEQPEKVVDDQADLCRWRVVACSDAHRISAAIPPDRHARANGFACATKVGVTV